ncbi:hypothetical protein AB6A40_005423 [Gnathostoma spinigerum]|uniref:Uncharacterized protein n=1 Tax=Gnathostoma spinigerum TaxID=75299 RepID=A0ABD6EKN1_9BILA
MLKAKKFVIILMLTTRANGAQEEMARRPTYFHYFMNSRNIPNSSSIQSNLLFLPADAGFLENFSCKKKDYMYMKQAYFCPTAPPETKPSEWPCIAYSDLCDKKVDCYGSQDEHPTFCMFHILYRKYPK